MERLTSNWIELAWSSGHLWVLLSSLFTVVYAPSVAAQIIPDAALPVGERSQVTGGNALALLGGDMNIQGGVLTAEQRRIELGSARDGIVNLEAGFALSYSGIQQFGDIHLSQQALADASGAPGGSISVQGNRVSLTDGSLLLIQNQGRQAAGSLQVNAADALQLSGISPSGQFRGGLNTETIGSGQGGNIAVSTRQLMLLNGAGISTPSYSAGRAGNITVAATDSAQLIGETSTFVSTINAFALSFGDSGNITLSTGRLSLLNGAIITSGAAAGNVDAGGYQILSNFPKLSHGFQTISITDVLQGRIPQNLMRDRIVLIGLMAESLESLFFTSYTTNSIEAPVGVEVHALFTSQLLSAALGGRPMLRVWSDPLEWGWIILWSAIGAAIGWVSRSPRQIILRVILLGVIFLGSAYGLFLAGWWIITVPPLLALVASTVISSSYLLWENLKEHARTLEQKVAERTLELKQEIAERKQAEETLGQQKRLLQTIVDHIPVMITLYDATGQVKFVNRQFEQMLGWSMANLHHIDLIAELSSDPQQRQQILEHMLTATGTWLDLKIRTKTNRLVNTSWTNVPIADRLFVGIGQDISDRKRAEKASILEERNRMAREIHDTLAQAFTGILLHVGAVVEEIPEESVTAQSHLETVDELARTGLTEARRSVAALRPKLLEEGNLFNALKHLTTQMRLSTNTNITCEIIGVTHTLSPDVENHLLRIGQEALTNAIKYANATHIHLELVCEEAQCVLRIKDNGQGFDVNQVPLNKGYGLLGMSERVEQIGGELIIQSQPCQGTEIIVVVSRE